jgi:hypothetical protein
MLTPGAENSNSLRVVSTVRVHFNGDVIGELRTRSKAVRRALSLL